MDTVDHVVKRPNETIGIVPTGKQRITHLVRRLYSVILLFSQQQGERQEYSAFLSDMLAVANSPGSNRTQVKAILREIRAIGVDWNVRNGDREIWKNVGLIEEPGLIDGKGTPTIVTWKLPAIIRARLLDPRGFFTRISLQMMTRLRSGASIALYEICCQYVSNDHGKGEGGLTGRAGVAEWMPRLTGSRKADYEYKFLKRDVVQPAMDEVNEITDLRVELIEYKVGRRVDEIQFRVFRKTDADRALALAPLQTGAGGKALEAVIADGACLSQVQAIGIPLRAAQRLCKKYTTDEAYLLRHVAYVEARIRNPSAKPIANRVAFLQKALDHGYAEPAILAPPTAFPLIGAPDASAPASTGLPARGPLKKQPTAADLVGIRMPPAEVLTPSPAPAAQVLLDTRQGAQQAAQQARADARSDALQRLQALSDPLQKQAVIDEFLDQANSTVKTFYKKNGINNMIVRMALTDWLMDVKSF